MKIFLEVEAPGWSGYTRGELPIELEVRAYLTGLIESRCGVKPKISLLLLADNHVVVDADALLALQKKAGLKQ